MKKFLSLVLAAMMLLSVASAANIFEEADLEAALELNRDPAVTCATWEGEWVLAAAYISEDFAVETVSHIKHVCSKLFSELISLRTDKI